MIDMKMLDPVGLDAAISKAFGRGLNGARPASASDERSELVRERGLNGARPASLPRPDADAIGRLDATDQAALIRDGEVTAEELVAAAIDRIERLNPSLNAVITPTFERALTLARTGPTAGPFAGVPYLLKDLAIEDAGVRFTEGSRFLADHMSTRDQELTVRLRQAGLVILG